MSDVDPLRGNLIAKLGIGDRQLNRLISQKEGETLLPRRLAILALAAENQISIRRFASEEDLSQLRALRNREANSSAAGPARPVAARSSGRNVDGRPPKPKKANKPAAKAKRPRRGKKVFVVHGRNEPLRRSLFSFLRSLNLDPLEWTKAIVASGKGTPTVGEIVDAAFAQASAIVVLLSPDDLVILKEQHRKSSDPSYETVLTGQSRPNVLFEAGMAFSRNPNSTVLVQVGDVKPFSDVGGRHVTRLTNQAQSRREFVAKLRNAGCDVDDGGTDWLTEGDFRISKEKSDGAK